MKRICFLLGNAQGNGGIARVVSIIANSLQEYAQVYVLSYCPPVENAGYSYNQEIVHSQLYSERMPMVKAIISQGARKRVNQYLLENEIDIIIGCGALYYPLAILASMGTRTKCYCWEHSDPAGTQDNRFQGTSRRMAVLFADKIVVLTKAAEEYYKETLRTKTKRLIQIYNPIGKDVAQQKEYSVETKRILSVGRLTYQKNFQLLVQIAAQVLPDFPEWKWEICGEGEDRKGLEALIAENHLERQLLLQGQVVNMYEKYHEYAFLVMTSRYEGFPMSLIEASANSLPLLAFDVPTGPSEIIVDGKNGFLVNCHENKRMVACIRELMENQELRKSMANHSYSLSSRFGINNIMDQWRELCEL